MGNLNNGKTASQDEVTGDMINGSGDMVMNWIWRLCKWSLKKVHYTRVKERGLK